MVEGSRRVSAQTGHMSVWDMLWTYGAVSDPFAHIYYSFAQSH